MPLSHLQLVSLAQRLESHIICTEREEGILLFAVAASCNLHSLPLA